jgi:hypothetical protein
MLEDVRANDQVIFTQGGNVVAIEIDAPKGGAGEVGEQPAVFVGEGHLASPAHQRRPEDTMSAAEIQRPRRRPERNAAPRNPLDGILSLEGVKGRIVPLFEVLG